MSSQGVVVVGGGLSGLTAAVQLGRLGVAARVCDAGSELGGRARTSRRRDFLLNYGAHRLYAGGAAATVLRQLDIPIDVARRGPNGGVAVWRGRAYTLPVGFCSLITTDLLSAHAKRELARLLVSLKTMRVDALQRISTAEWLRTHLSDAAVKRLVLCLVRQTTYCNDPARLSAAAAIEQLRLSLSGDVLHVHGGWASLVDALQMAATADGVEIMRGTRAVAVHARAGRVTSVALANGESVPAGAVIIATSPRTVRELLRSAIDYDASATELRVAALDLALRNLPCRRIRFAFGVDDPWSYTADSLVARVAPADGAVVHLVTYLPSGSVGSSTEEEQMESVLDILQPGWRTRVVFRRFMPTVTVAHAMVAADAGGFGGRPSAQVPGLDNVFLAGDWVGPVGQLSDASIASAVSAAFAAARSLSKEASDHAAE
jgi:phytoene dehydrogenase-like protein